jgi:hypothetical protein
VVERDAQVLAELGQAARVPAQLGDRGAGRADRGAADLRGLAERAERGARRLGQRRQVAEEPLELPGALRERPQRGALLVDGRLQLRHRRPQLLQEAGEPLEAAGDVAVALGRVLRDLARRRHEAADLLLVAREVAHDDVRVPGEVGEHLVLLGEDREHAVGLAQCGARAADRLVEVVAVARDRGAQLVDQDAEPLADRQPHDVVDEVGRDGRRRALDGDRGARLELAGIVARGAVDVVLADERLGRDLAARVLAQRPEAVLGDLEGDDRATRRAIEVELRDRARDHARDLEVAALDEAEGVVELDLELVALRPVGRAGRQRGVRADGDDQDQGCREALHFGSVWVGSQLKSGDGLYGLDPSDAGTSAAPGQRLRWSRTTEVRDAVSRSGSGIGRTTPPTWANALT